MQRRLMGLTALLLAAAIPIRASPEQTMRQELIDELTRGASNIVQMGDVGMNREQTESATMRYAAAPERFDLREAVRFNGAKAQLCDDCGYTVIRQ